MLIGVLANTGGLVYLPEAECLRSGPSEAEVQFVDAAGRVLATFQRTDLLMFTRNTSSVALTALATVQDGQQPASAPPPVSI